jgi:hypothetical protein
MRTDRSLGVAFAGGATAVGCGRLSNLTYVTEVLLGGGMFENDDRFREKCCRGSLTNLDRSGVEIIVRAVDTPKQCFKVSSIFLISPNSH